MAAVDDLDEVVEQYHLAAREFVSGTLSLTRWCSLIGMT